MSRRFSFGLAVWLVAAAVPVAFALPGCGAEPAASSPAADAAATDGAAAADSTSAADGAATAADAADAGPAKPQPPQAPVFAGTCPDLQTGLAEFSVGGHTRRAEVYLPDSPSGAGVLFLWHGLGDSAKNFANGMGAKAMANTLGLIVVVPNSCCAYPVQKACCNQLTAWNFVSEFDRDLSLFDGLLSCLDQQHSIDRGRVYSSGFSAGALWTTFLIMNRSEYLAAAGPMSGGINNFNPWTAPKRPIPVIDTSGGPTDVFGNGLIDFQASTADLNAELTKGGHFVVHCQHELGHTVPAKMAMFVMEFLAAHRWGDSQSPMAQGLPATAPAGCKTVK